MHGCSSIHTQENHDGYKAKNKKFSVSVVCTVSTKPGIANYNKVLGQFKRHDLQESVLIAIKPSI